MIKRIFTVLILVISHINAANISGYVVDKNSGETIIGVNVILENTYIGAATDTKGFFIIRNVPLGYNNLIFSHISYNEYKLNISLEENNLFLENIVLTPAPIQTKAIEVIGEKSSIIKKDMDISSFEVDPVLLFEAPTLRKDVFKLMKFSPSVSISDPSSPQFHVRGSDPGENLVQLDGMTIYNPQHFMAAQAIFNPYAIKNIEMLVGGFDAEYGGRNASILNITSREGHKSETHGEFRPSISGLSGAVEFPVNNHSTAMISGRYISDITFRILMGVPNVLSDFIGSYQTKISSTKLRFTAFYAKDYMDYNIAGFTIYIPDTLFDNLEEGFITNTENKALGVQSRSVLTPNLLLESHLYYSNSNVNNNTYVNFAFTDTTYGKDVIINYDTKITNGISDFTAKVNFTYYTFLNQTLKLGMEINRLDMLSKIGNSYETAQGTEKTTQLNTIFAQDKIELGHLLIKFGARNTLLGNTWRVEPRASIAYNTLLASFKIAWGQYNQYITTMNNKNNEFVQTLDYYNSLDNSDPVSSEHFIAGIEGHITEKIDFSLTGYYKDLKTLYKLTYADASSQNAESILERGSGEAYGLEAMLRGEAGRLSGWLSYTYSHGTRRFPSILDGDRYLYDGDQPHNLKLVALYKLTRDITSSTTFQFSSGYPKTWETAKYSQFQYDPVNDVIGWFPRDLTPVKNNVRFPPRMQLDIGWKKKLRSGFGHQLAEYIGAEDAYFTMTIKNILFLYRNPFYYFYFQDYGYYGFSNSYFPSVYAGYSIKF